MTKIVVFNQIKKITNLKTPRDVYFLMDFMTSNNPQEVRRAATFRLSALLMQTRKCNLSLYHLICKIFLYELTQGIGKHDTWLQRNILEALIPNADREILRQICEHVKEGHLNYYTVQKVNKILNCG